jgi:single-stranded-DNA-specific exonuclease
MHSAAARIEIPEFVPDHPSLPPPPSNAARDLAKALGLTLTVADLLLRRGHADPARTRGFLEPRLADLTPPQAMADRALAAERLARAIRSAERIAVFGDYDCDGITSAAILSDVLRALGASVAPLLASRFDGGYGVSAAAVERIVASGARVLVTCDCGSSDHVSLAELSRRGLDVIVIDHHLVPEQKLPALAFLNPHRPECGFPYKGLASCGLALSVAAALRAELGAALDLRKWLDLVAIGSIADVAPLDGDNRALVRAGLRALREGRRPGVRALLELAQIDGAFPITAADVAFRIAPRLNAPGRLGAPDVALELLLSDSHERARALAAEVEQLTLLRREAQERILQEAVEEIEREGFAERPAIVVGREGWNPGIVGIVAGRLAERFGRPAVVIGFQNGSGRGSVRGPAGARLYDALSLCADALERFGGHQAAAGLELSIERLADLRSRFEQAFAGQAAAPALPEPLSRDVARLDAADDPARVLEELWLLEPCGRDNPAPTIALSALVVAAREVKGGHLKLELELDSKRRVAAFGVGMGSRASELEGRCLAFGRLRPDRWRGGGAVELVVERVESI